MISRKVKHVVAFALTFGITMAAISRVIAATPTSTIYSFGSVSPDGKIPKGSLTYANDTGLLFGRTTETVGGAGYGAIFQLDPNNPSSTYRIDHMFAGHDADCPDGDNPRHDAMTPLNGRLYGTTLDGGTHNNGIIFSIAQDGTDYQVLFSLHNSIGDESHSCFVIVDNLLYGMTASGGDDDEGVVFSFDPAGPPPACTPTPTPTVTPSKFQTLFSFACESAGKEPHGRLTLDPNGTTLYGMTRKGGARGFGIVFSIDTSGKNYSVLHDFNGGADDGATSDHGYVVQSGDHLYGLTTLGGHHDDGVIFKLKIDDGTFQLLHKFGETHHDGANPYGSLLLDGDNLYGTTANGGDYDMGTVFVIRTDGHGYNRLYSFGGNSDDGSHPIDNVILVKKALYGLTTGGGSHGHGAIFKVTASSRPRPSPAPRPTPRG